MTGGPTCEELCEHVPTLRNDGAFPPQVFRLMSYGDKSCVFAVRFPRS